MVLHHFPKLFTADNPRSRAFLDNDLKPSRAHKSPYSVVLVAGRIVTNLTFSNSPLTFSNLSPTFSNLTRAPKLFWTTI